MNQKSLFNGISRQGRSYMKHDYYLFHHDSLVKLIPWFQDPLLALLTQKSLCQETIII